MSESKDKYLGARFTESERKFIDKFLKKYNRQNKTNLNITEFIRTAIFTHIYHLENSNQVIDLTSLLEFKNELDNLIKTIIIK